MLKPSWKFGESKWNSCWVIVLTSSSGTNYVPNEHEDIDQYGSFIIRVGVNSIPELELQLNSNSNSGIGIGIGIEIGGIENGIGIENPGIGIGIGIENRNWIFCNCYRSNY